MTRALAGVLFALGAAGCTTVADDIETPSGPIEGDFFEQMQVLGISDRQTVTLNQSSSGGGFQEVFDIRVPVGTQLIVPAVRGWQLGFGDLDPNTSEAHAGGGTWNTADHHWGIGRVLMRVVDIDAPDLSATPPPRPPRSASSCGSATTTSTTAGSVGSITP